jgi:hypothetical protein
MMKKWFCKGLHLYITKDSSSLAEILPPEIRCTNGTIAIVTMETAESMTRLPILSEILPGLREENRTKYLSIIISHMTINVNETKGRVATCRCAANHFPLIYYPIFHCITSAGVL